VINGASINAAAINAAADGGVTGILSADIFEADVSALVYNDFTSGIPADATIYYTMDLTTPGGLVRTPISSWQATLRAGTSNYVQCVVPAAAALVDDLTAATLFSIVREAHFDGNVVRQQMASAVPVLQLARGTRSYTCTLSGYSDGFTENNDPDALYDRPLMGINSVFTSPNSTRASCQIDWLLRPGQRAIIDESTSFIVSYITYYVNTSRAYMDAGS